MIAIQGTFTKIEQIASRKVARLHIEIPIEMADKALQTLGGFPDPANAKWVGIAQLNPEIAVKHEVEKEGTHTQHIIMACKEGAFRRYCTETHGSALDGDWDEEATTDFVRSYCDVSSRSDVTVNSPAGYLWRKLWTDYKNWLNE